MQKCMKCSLAATNNPNFTNINTSFLHLSELCWLKPSTTRMQLGKENKNTYLGQKRRCFISLVTKLFTDIYRIIQQVWLHQHRYMKANHGAEECLITKQQKENICTFSHLRRQLKLFQGSKATAGYPTKMEKLQKQESRGFVLLSC